MINLDGTPCSVKNTFVKETFEPEKEITQLQAITKYIAHFAKKHNYRAGKRLWMNPLPKYLYLEDIIEENKEKNKDKKEDKKGKEQRIPQLFCNEGIQICLGVFDDPENQEQPKFYFNLIECGHVGIGGRSVSGKSTFLQTFIFSLLNKYSEKIHSDITSGKEKIEFKYTSTIKDLENIKESFYSLLEKNRARDCERGITSIGPHRDDFVVLINDIDTKSYGSQGQQRTAVLTIKFASLKIIKELTGEHPVLLLDDVLSELDFSRKRYILSTIGDIQTIITCTGIEDLYEYLDDKSKVFKVKDGEILN